MSGRLCRCAHSKNAHVQVAHSAFFHFARLTAAAHNPKNGLRKIVWGSTRSRIFFGDLGLPSAVLCSFKKCSCALTGRALQERLFRATITMQGETRGPDSYRERKAIGISWRFRLLINNQSQSITPPKYYSNAPRFLRLSPCPEHSRILCVNVWPFRL